MIVWRVENYRKSVTCYRSERVYDVLVDDFGRTEEDAIEAESWSELASVDEVYQGDGFKVYVEEE